MSVLVADKPISMWTNEELRELFDCIVCTEGITPFQAAMAETLSRLLSDEAKATTNG